MAGVPSFDRTLVLGIVNVTPDSFSDGGDWIATADAVARGRQLLADGADIIDVGGESTRPGAERPRLEVELNRVLPVIETLVAEGACVSIDTMRSEVAEAAVAKGAAIVNDVSGGLADPRMLEVVAAAGVHYIAMHWRGFSDVMSQLTSYDAVVTDVCRELGERRDAALGVGIRPDRLILDPGLGFAKEPEHNWALLAGLDRLEELGFPLVIGSSRKRFLGELLADDEGIRPPRQRDAATAALTALLAQRPVWGVRTHTAREHRDAVAVADRLRREPTTSSPVDEIRLTGIGVDAIHGVYDFERERPQRFVADVTCRVVRPAHTDDLATTVNYAALSQQVAGELQRDPVDLIETLAERVADACLADPFVRAVEVTIHKPQAAMPVPVADISVTISRSSA